MIFIVLAVSKLIQLYMLMIMVYSFGSFFPTWRYQAWYRWVCEFVYPYLSLFRGLNLRSGNMDFTPLVAIIVLQLLSYALTSAFYGGH